MSTLSGTLSRILSRSVCGSYRQCGVDNTPNEMVVPIGVVEHRCRPNQSARTPTYEGKRGNPLAVSSK